MGAAAARLPQKIPYRDEIELEPEKSKHAFTDCQEDAVYNQ